MLGFFKNLLRKPLRRSAEAASGPADIPASSVADAPAAPPAANARTAPARKHPATGNGRVIEVSLQRILATLPLELQPRVREADVGDMTITVSLEKVLAQLSRGAVRITFGELRHCAPEVFTSESDRDRVLVSLPLAEILSRLNPALITRRRTQRQVEVPAEISSPFDAHGRGLVFAIGPAKPESPSAFSGGPARHVAPTPPAPGAPGRSNLVAARSPAAPGATPMSVPPARLNLTAAATPAPPSGVIPPPGQPSAPPPIAQRSPAPAEAVPKPIAPTRISPKPVVTPIAPAAPKAPVAPKAPAPPPPSSIPFSVSPKPLTPERPAQQPPVKPPAVPEPAAAEPPSPEPVAPLPAPADLKLQEQAAPAEPPKPTAPVTTGEPVLVKLTTVAEGWPEPVRKEIVALRLVDASVALPAHVVEQALKQGRVVFSWKMLRSWVKPAPTVTESANDSTVVELPLKVVAPLFLAKQKAQPHQKVAIDEDIPNLFFGFPQPETGTPVAQATARPADTNFYVWDESSDTVRMHESEVKRGPSPGTKFVAKYATPNEVVSRAAALDGVNGALIALPDGLMVANRLPPEMNADTLAAFLPQIFGKVSQCTKELRMGELNNLNFTVGNVPWKIFRVNAIFFAAFGRAGEPLPTAQLAALAAELDHKPK